MRSHTAKDLYQQTIIEHNKDPHNCFIMNDATHTAKGYNPLCGDQVDIFLKIRNNTVENISFQGDGCAISRASASVMTGILKGKTLKACEKIFKQFEKIVKTDEEDLIREKNLSALSTFNIIRQFPSRIKCATLSWQAFKAAVEHQKMVSTE